MVRPGVLLAGAVLLAGIGGIVVYVRRTVVPPGCRDARVLAMVRQTLIDRAALPETVRIKNISMSAGGPLAFRFVCAADLGGLRHAPLPPGPRPGKVRYVTRLVGPDRRLSVTVRIIPLLVWSPVQ